MFRSSSRGVCRRVALPSEEAIHRSSLVGATAPAPRAHYTCYAVSCGVRPECAVNMFLLEFAASICTRRFIAQQASRSLTGLELRAASIYVYPTVHMTQKRVPALALAESSLTGLRPRHSRYLYMYPTGHDAAGVARNLTGLRPHANPLYVYTRRIMIMTLKRRGVSHVSRISEPLCMYPFGVMTQHKRRGVRSASLVSASLVSDLRAAKCVPDGRRVMKQQASRSLIVSDLMQSPYMHPRRVMTRKSVTESSLVTGLADFRAATHTYMYPTVHAAASVASRSAERLTTSLRPQSR